MIVRLEAGELAGCLGELAALFADAVAADASIGFRAGTTRAELAAWWAALEPDMAEGRLLVWVARSGGQVDGAVQVRLEGTPSRTHRAEVAKLVVHRRARRKGLARGLLAVAERAAAERGRTLLLLDVETASPAERLYRAQGWTEYGLLPNATAGPAGDLRSTSYYYKTLDAG
ncbi:GNAT family N-acetyltransferase [Actinocorallia populi]|uniref:GNAT family N-acetyltransferase n=1 Tax=Actinocorallia populi TaxID=2079200 RepID=UPI000D0922D6|nr:GNAT family N-acetyltransferase [Actinocorallia populi]